MSTEQQFEAWYNKAFLLRGVDTRHMNDCEDAYRAGRKAALLEAAEMCENRVADCDDMDDVGGALSAAIVGAMLRAKVIKT